jgi:molybdopterin-binding protein
VKRLLYLIIATGFVALVSCAPTITSTTTLPDGTVTTVVTKGGVDHDAFVTGVDAAALIAKAHIIAEK